MKKMNRGCDTCMWFQKIVGDRWEGRVGICEYDDCSLEKIYKKCDNWKGKKYKREKYIIR